MPSLIERRKISITPIQTSSPMAESKDSKKPIEKNSQKSKKKSFRSFFFSCKYHQTAVEVEKKKQKPLKRIGWSGSLCNLRESSKVMQRPEPTNSSESYSSSSVSSSNNNNLSASINSTLSSSSSSSSSLGGSFKGMHLRRLSGCYECNMVVDPVTGISKVPSLRSNALFPCSDCGEIFTKSESLEIHQAIKHAVSELGPEDSSRNIIEIIFKSSWFKKQAPVYKMHRILKVHHAQKTITKFENYRDSIKNKANKLSKKHQRCIADGNELLRFYCTSLNCSLGLNSSTNLCASNSKCDVCSIIKDGFKPDELGRIRTMATSGRAHDADKRENKERAMLVCRVIAGRVKRNEEVNSEEFDSVAGSSNAGVCSSLDELFVFDTKAILPCFVVIYSSF
ncbi:uncharacterized protein A4U43_C09F9340 [Asparagus officinalis]|uniref:C2H2-type domain-containing protein n=1 Tax=Asparagus officinalis TaxID=4686 RepID=A0A5P1E6C6_ASPOF|nr:uncharacterized protein LOC109824771 [Asparagus officinalis]ONK58194.1 uncharacterized protein A4U43_C09F9340 [Asparagus officinalis]